MSVRFLKIHHRMAGMGNYVRRLSYMADTQRDFELKGGSYIGRLFHLAFCTQIHTRIPRS
jgi:hypothetical protein